MRALGTFIIAFMIMTTAAQAEVIEIHDYSPPKPSASYNPRRLPAYSDEAIEHDAWVRAWLLLDIDAHGKVTRFKFLKRPGYNLETIAANEVWSLSFDPAHTKGNTPIETNAIWSIEWPSHGWLLAKTGLASAWPHPDWLTGLSPAVHVACAGTGPWKAAYAGYRDCSLPDVSRADSEKWIDRPAR